MKPILTGFKEIVSKSVSFNFQINLVPYKPLSRLDFHNIQFGILSTQLRIFDILVDSFTCDVENQQVKLIISATLITMDRSF